MTMMKKERREIYCRLQKTNKNIFFLMEKEKDINIYGYCV